jgi:glutathione S-transferase
VLWALEELSLSSGLEYNLKSYKREKGRAPEELKKVFPLGKSPVLEIPGVSLFRPLPFIHDGNHNNNETKTIVTESRLILQLLSEKYSNSEWVPETDEDKDRDTYFLEFANSSLTGVVNSILYFQIVPAYSPWPVRPLMYAIFNPIAKILKQGLDPHFDLMERALSDEKPWFSGAKIGLADLTLSFPMDTAYQRQMLDEKKYPKLAGWVKRIHDRPAYQNALKKGGSYDLIRYDN